MESWVMINEIKRRAEAEESVAEISRAMGVDRKTVRKYRGLTREEVGDFRKKNQGRPSKLKDHKEWLKGRVREYEEDGVVNAVSICRELKERGYEGSERSVRRAVSGMISKVRKRIYEPFETGIGKQGMVDLGESRKIRMGSMRCAVYFIAMVLCHSRKKYAEWYERPISTETFLQFHERAFLFFEGIPEEIVYDQTKLAVIKERFGEVQFNEDFYAFSRFYGFKTYICNKRDPETKGKVESVVRYAKRGFLPGRNFIDIRDLQGQWNEWLMTVADAKVHETTKKIPNEVWEEEREHLQPMPDSRYVPQPAMEKRKALQNGLVKVLGNRYSVPSSHHGEEVLVRITEEKIEIYSRDRTHLYSHWRSLGQGRTIKDPSHYTREYSVPTEELEARVLAVYGSRSLLEGLKGRYPRHYRQQLRELMRISRDHAEEDLRHAAKRAVNFHCFTVTEIHQIIRGVEANQVSIPHQKLNNAAVLTAGDTEVRGLEYYENISLQIQEEQDEQACL